MRRGQQRMGMSRELCVMPGGISAPGMLVSSVILGESLGEEEPGRVLLQYYCNILEIHDYWVK